MADRRQQFVAKYMPYAVEASERTGIDPGVIIAQAAHETAWGRKAPGNNFFGIKGKGQSFATHEYVGGRRVNMKAGFRRYDSPRESFLDWAELMHHPRYAGVRAAQTPEEQIKALKAAGYATDPAYVSKLNSVRNTVTKIAGDMPALVSGPNVDAIMDVASLNDAAPMPDQPTAAQGYAPNIAGALSPAQSAIDDMLAGEPMLSEADIDQMTMVDEAGNYLNPVQPAVVPPTLPPQWADATGFPIDEALTGASAQDVLAGGPRLNPLGPAPAPPTPFVPGSGPVPPDMGQMRSPADVLAAGPRMDPRRQPIDPDLTGMSAQQVLDGGPRLSQSAQSEMARIDAAMQPRPRPEVEFVQNAQSGAPDASLVPSPQMRPDPFASTFAARPEGPASGMPAAPPVGIEAIAGEEQFGPGNEMGRIIFDNTSRMRANREAMDSRFLARDLGDQRRQMEALTPPWRGGPEHYPPEAFTGIPDDMMQPMDQRFDEVAGPPQPWETLALPAQPPPSFPDALPGLDMPPQPQPLMADRFNDAFSPAGGGQIMDLQEAFNRRQAPGLPAPPATAQEGINSVFGSPPAQAAPPNLAIPFAEVPGFGMGTADAATPAVTPPLGASATVLPSLGMEEFDARFGGGSVVDVPQPGQAGVTQGTMPEPMDIRSPAQQGAAEMPPASAPSIPAPTVEPPRQKNAGIERSPMGGMAGRIIGGLLGGPLGAIGGGLIGRGLLNGGGGGGFSGFGGQPSYAWSASGSAPYGNNGGSTIYQKGTSNAAGGSNALSWQGSNGQQVTVVQDPWTGTYYGPSYSGGGLY